MVGRAVSDRRAHGRAVNYRTRKVLVPKFYLDEQGEKRRQASMTVARFVPWGIPEPTGIRLRTIARYLETDMKTVWRWTNVLGIHRYHGPAERPTRRLQSRGHLISEEDVARLLVHARTRQAAGSRGLGARRGVSTGE